MSDFYTVLVASGYMPTKIVADGRFYRCKTVDKPHHRNGAYLLDSCGRRGVFKNYATDLDWNSWSMDGHVSPAEFKRELDAARVMRIQAAKEQKVAIQAAADYFASIKPLKGSHQYITNKGLSMLGCAGLRTDKGLLVIPVMRDGHVQSLQTIDAEGNKRYRTGCPIKGGVYVLDRPGAGLTCFVEGFATGLAVYQSLTNCRVIVCFDANNLIEVSKYFQGMGLGVVCADNDHQTEKRIGFNKGIEAGKKASENMGCGIAYPEGIKGSDWADAIDEFGLDALRWIARKINVKAKPFRRNT